MKRKDLTNGDLLFVASSDEMGRAIQTSTGAYSHVALYWENYIYHACQEKGVVKEPLNEILQEGVVDCYSVLNCDLEKVKRKAEKELGRPYNASFYPQSEGLYCSEYMAKIFPIFEEIPMEFGDEEGEVSPFWQTYYQELGVAVPLHLAGTNPSQLAQSNYLVYKGRIDDSDSKSN